MSEGTQIGTRHSASGIRAAFPTLLGLLVLVLLTANVRAQLLDLDRPQPTEPGEGNAALRLAEELEDQIESIDGTPTDLARAAVRTLAINLLRTGEYLGQPGSHRVIIGTSLSRRLDEIDGVIGNAALNNADRAQLSADLELLAESLPDAPDELDRAMRDALAILMTGSGASAGWHNHTTDNSALAPKIETWLADGLLTDSTARSLGAFDSLLAEAALQPGYARSASWLRNRINLAASGINGLPDWMNDDSASALRAAFDAGVAALCIDSDDDSATATLDGIFYISDACTRVPMINDDRVADATRRALDDVTLDPRSARESFGAIDNLVIAIAVLDRPIPQPQTRQLRPAGKAMMGRARRLRNDLEAAITNAIETGARSDPATLSLIARANRFRSDSDMIDRIDALLAPAGDKRDEWRSGAARHLLVITREMGDKQTEPDAFARLRKIDDQVSLGRAILLFCDRLDTPEPELETELDVLVDERRIQLSAMLRRAVSRAERSLAEPGAPIPDNTSGLELRLLNRQITLIDDFLLVRSIVGFSDPHNPHNPHNSPEYALAAVPAWGLSRDDLRLLLDPLEGRLIQLNAALLDGDDQLRATLLPMTEQDGSLVRLVALLERGARERYKDSTGAESVFARVALGAPMPDSWMGEHRDRLAAISRYATELAGAERINDERYIRTLTEYVRFESARLLNTLD